MFNTFRSRILTMVAGIILLTTLTMWYSVFWQSHSTITTIQEEHAENVLNAIMASIENEYKSISFYRSMQLQMRKKELENMVGISMQIIASMEEKVQKGKLTRSQAQKDVIDLFQNLRYDNGTGYFWINNTDLSKCRLILYGADQKMSGALININDSRYNCLVDSKESLFKKFNETALNSDGGYVKYYWPRPDSNGKVHDEIKLSFVKLFKPWQWIIGSGLYIDDIEKEAQKRVKAIINELAQTFSSIKFGKSGYMFLIASNKDILIHPVFKDMNVDDLEIPQSAKDILEMLLAQPDKKTSYVEYRAGKPEDLHHTYLKRSYVRYFKPLDWYICISYYKDDMDEPLTILSKRLLLLSGILVLIALGLAILLSRNLSTPLKKLAFAAETIDRKGFDATSIPITGSSETRDLGTILSKAFNTIKLKEQSLVASSEKLRITLDSIGDAVIATDTSGKITTMNKAAEKLTKWPKNDVIGQSIDSTIQFLNPNTNEQISCPVIRVLGDGRRHDLEQNAILCASDGSRHLVNDSCAPISDPSGKLMGAVIALRDVTEQSRLEEELRQAQKMDSLGQLAGGIAHDFNNMLAGIMSSAELLESKLPTENTSGHKFTKLIISTCRRAVDLTEKLLAFSRKGKIMSTPIDLNSVITDALTILERSLDKKIELYHILKARKTTVIGDPTQLQNMVINLGVNGGHAMPQGGVLTITTRNIYLDDAYCLNSSFNLIPGEYIEIKIEDTGEGISQSNIQHIFEPFFTTKEVGKGTGLGLAAVYGSVKEHHGEVLVSSRINEGTVFRIHLPINRENIEVSKRPDIEKLISGSGSILVIDDESIIRTVVQNSLTDLGYKIILASDGEEGVNIYSKDPGVIDLVILDMVMPKMDGRECFKRLKEINPDIKVIVASGFMNTSSVSEMRQAGVQGFIQKPYRRAELSRLISELI